MDVRPGGFLEAFLAEQLEGTLLGLGVLGEALLVWKFRRGLAGLGVWKRPCWLSSCRGLAGLGVWKRPCWSEWFRRGLAGRAL